MKFRPYQIETIDSIWNYFTTNPGNPVAALPTGTGKSLCIAGCIKRAIYEYPGTRILVCTHVKELIEQNAKALKQIWRTAPVGINSAGLKKRDLGHQIIYCGIGSVYRDALKLGRRDLLFIDECHLVNNYNDSMYQQLIGSLREANPMLKVVGFSATPYRMGQGMVTDGGIFNNVCIDLTLLNRFNEFIDNYYLSELIPKRTGFTYDVSEIKVSRGDFNQKDLQVSVDKAVLTRRALTEACDLGLYRKKWLVFASGIDHAEHVAQELTNMGVPATCVHSKITDIERDRRLDAHRKNHVKAMVNNSVLTTGYDDPEIDLIVDLAPTTSPGRHVQKNGRGTRPVYHHSFDREQLEDRDNRREAIAKGGKANCLVLDFAGNTARLGPINDPVIPLRRGPGTGDPPVKICDVCGCYNHTTARYCADCRTEFTFRVNLSARASDVELIRREDTDIEIHTVTYCNYKIHRKKAKPPSLMCSYWCGSNVFKEWVCFEHTAPYAKHAAHEWWRQRCPDDPPSTVEDALKVVDNLRKPTKLRVRVGGKYPEIIGYEF